VAALLAARAVYAARDEALRIARAPLNFHHILGRKLQERLAKVGIESMPMSSDEFGRYVGADVLSTAKLMQQIGIKPGRWPPDSARGTNSNGRAGVRKVL